MEQPVIHIVLHFIVPLLIALVFFRKNWRKAWMLMLLSLLIDLDHLLASPYYAPDRCSIGFHPLHEWYMALPYFLLALIPLTRIVGIGLILHLLLDGFDCYRMVLVLPE